MPSGFLPTLTSCRFSRLLRWTTVTVPLSRLLHASSSPSAEMSSRLLLVPANERGAATSARTSTATREEIATERRLLFMRNVSPGAEFSPRPPGSRFRIIAGKPNQRIAAGHPNTKQETRHRQKPPFADRPACPVLSAFFSVLGG